MTSAKNSEAFIHGLSHDGRGIATIENKATFISGALPNETLTYRITQKRSNYNEAVPLEFIKTSEERVAPPCQHFGLCGGCNLQHMRVTTQLKLKEATLLDHLKHFGKVSPENILTPLSARDLGYRRKARLGVKFVIKKNKMLVGFREKASNYLAELDECKTLHPRIGEHLKELSELILSLEAYRTIPQIEVAIGDEDVALVFRHLEDLSHHDKAKLISFAKTFSFHIYLQPNSPAQVYKLWPDDKIERLTYTLPAYQLKYLFHPLDFTQINLEMNRLMITQALSLLDLKLNERVLDLFCGIGNFTLPIARYAQHVTGIEGSAEMVARAQDNARHNHLTNVSFHAANLENPPQDASWLNLRYDKILLDPPRVGAKEMMPVIKDLGAKRILYISCNPATLARDAGELVHNYGFQLTKAGVMNMFPHTAHIEAMAVFDKV